MLMMTLLLLLLQVCCSNFQASCGTHCGSLLWQSSRWQQSHWW
jgi:hypothetical protein